MRKFFRIFNLDFDADWINNKASTNRVIHILVNEYVLILLFTILSIGSIFVFYNINLLGISLFIFFALLNLFLKLSVRIEPKIIYLLNIVLTYVPLMILSHEISKDSLTHGVNGLSDILLYFGALVLVIVMLIYTSFKYGYIHNKLKKLGNVRQATSKDIPFIEEIYKQDKDRKCINTDLDNIDITNLKDKTKKQKNFWIIYNSKKKSWLDEFKAF